jgi:hypothetical protein
VGSATQDILRSLSRHRERTITVTDVGPDGLTPDFLMLSFHVAMWLTVLTHTAKGLPETVGDGASQAVPALPSVELAQRAPALVLVVEHVQAVQGLVDAAKFGDGLRQPRRVSPDL